MHEMSLCEGIVDLIAEEARRHGFTRVKSITIDVGVLGHVDPQALAFGFDVVSRGTLADGARLVIEQVAGAGWCMDCSKTVPLAERFGACPECGQHHVQMTAGDELKLRELEVE
jgi:hydrogenase nickel incorporation protein HypA/HybF